MNHLELIGSPQSVFVRTVRLALHEKGVPYQLTAAAPHSPLVNAIHPYGLIPVLRHGQRTLFESKAITAYIDLAFDGPPLLPSDAYERALAEQWISLLNTTILPSFVSFTKSFYFPDANRTDSIDELPEKVADGLRLMDRCVNLTGVLVGNSFSLADMSLMPILDYLWSIPPSQTEIESLQNLERYFRSHGQRDSWIATDPPPMSEIGAAQSK